MKNKANGFHVPSRRFLNPPANTEARRTNSGRPLQGIDLSIVIPSFNTKKLLANCLKSIKPSYNNKYNVETVVVDNASSDGSVEMLKNKFSSNTLIFNKENLGFAKASNIGWNKARGKYILFLNSDTVLAKDDLFNVLKYIYSNENQLGALSGKLILRNGKPDPDCHRGFPTPWSSVTFFLGLEKLFPKSRLFAQYHQGWKDVNQIHEIDAGCGAFLVVKKSLLKKLHGFDEDYFFYGEDIDLCYRIKQLHLKIIYFPQTKTLHYKGASSGLRKESNDISKPTRESLIKATKGSIDAWKRFYKKFYADKYPRLITLLVLSGIQLKGAIRTINNYLK